MAATRNKYVSFNARLIPDHRLFSSTL